MQKESLLHLIKSPVEFDSSSLEALEHAIDTYPYFQPLYALKLKLLKYNNSYRYNNFLKETAAHTQDRSVLFDLITSSEFEQLKIADKIDELIQYEKETSEFEINEEFVNQINDPELFVEKEASPQEHSGEPLNFNSAETHSFNEWLKLTQIKPINETEDNGQSETNNPQFRIIDEFIKNNPKIVPTKTYEASDRIIAKHEPSTSLMTETLARVYVEQKRYDKAIQAFKILILNNPEKSTFFADQIQEIERLKENK
ncbi:hypothetical protein [Psychroflexus tropicus]|uniref:hypothetical protein n=1 Tax=Psychroflexus tropicus TaxID=197345 RepID=UPI000367EF87|nr:hypothetical protein [Psychroflexus tropicus]